ncbi:MAG: hypothetical protein ACLT98_10730 [Eggerthellaceae bacterium]
MLSVVANHVLSASSSATTRQNGRYVRRDGLRPQYRYCQILDGVLAGGDDPLFGRTAWTFAPRQEGQAGRRPGSTSAR